MPSHIFKLLTPILFILTIDSAWAQVTPPLPPSNLPNSNIPSAFNPDQIHQRYEQRIRDALDVNDTEWHKLAPHITRVLELRAGLITGMGGGTEGSFDGPPPGAFNAGPPNAGMPPPPTGNSGTFGLPPGPRQRGSELQERYYDLQGALDDSSSSTAIYRERINALHKARVGTQHELVRAQNKLRSLITPLQEAVLITAGILD
jgi:hypothetical protein